MVRIACKTADLLPLDAIEDLQGGLKKRSKKDIELITKSIEKYGFSFPFFVWKNGEHILLLQRKWGGKIVKKDKGSRRSFDFNPIIHIPIKGV